MRKATFARTNAARHDFHLHPHYREQTAFDAALVQLRPGFDEFTSEQHQEKLGGILAEWKTGLLGSPQNIGPVEKTLSKTFAGTSWVPVEQRLARSVSNGLEVRRVLFELHPSLAPELFLSEMRSSLSNFSSLLIAEFQITRVEAHGADLITHVRYEVVGTGKQFYREQRVGTWLIQWDGLRVQGWRALDEIRSRAAEPFYTDVTHSAFGSNPSYGSQMLHGADYWRTILDGASGIDIYGHNGVSVGDIDGDGHDDVYVCQAAGLPNRLYRNRGDGTFEDITESSGVGVLENTACALFADFRNSGRQDLVVVRANGPLLFLNEGRGKFVLKPGAFKFANLPQGTFTGAAAADYDRDGRLDLYFCLYTYYQGADQYKYPAPYFAAENGPPNFLMHNTGDGIFQDVTAQCGLDKNNTRFSFCCGWADYNRDGWPDLYVVNDFGKKNLYRNNGDGTFSDIAGEAGVEDVGAGMSVSWFDCDNDGNEDLYVANMWTAAGERIANDEAFQKIASNHIQAMYRKHAMGNSLLHNEGNEFRDVTAKSQTGNGRWAWSSDGWDFDHDGFVDLYVANGMISGPIQEDLNSFFWRQVVARSPNAAKSDTEYEKGWNAVNELIRSDYSWSGFERNILYANNGDGTFSDVSGAVGMDFLEDGRAFAIADFDGDGRQEVLIKNRNGPQLRLMKNTVSSLPPAISFRLQGTKSNRDGIGASITIQTSAGRQTKTLQAGSGFLSQHSKGVFFGLGFFTGSISASIKWPSGLIQQVRDLASNHRVWITEGSELVRVEPFKARQEKSGEVQALKAEKLPETSETWLLVPVAAPMHKPTIKTTLLSFGGGFPAGSSGRDVEVVEVSPDDKRNEELCAVYNLLSRYLFDRHSDLPLPSSFLINEHGLIVKIYRGPVDRETVESDARNAPLTDAERLAMALPFPTVSGGFEYGRNYLSLGSIFFQRGYLEPAADFFQSALKDDPASAEAFYGLGSVYLKQQKNREARDCFQSAAKLKASYPDTTPNAWNNLGLIATRDSDIVKAVECFQEALRFNPDHFVALENLGNAYRQQGHWEEARGTLQRAIATKPKDPEANYSLGMVFAQLDDVARAYEYLQRALDLRPNYPEALNNLGVLYLRTRRRDEAVASFERCMQVAPTFDQAYLNLARVYAVEGNPEKGRSILKALLTKRPEDETALRALEQLH